MGKKEFKALEPAELISVWERFIVLAAKDPALLEFARGRRICTLYRVQDAGLDFYLAFEDGRVSGGVGAPPGRANVTLTMSAADFDGLYNGSLDGRRATLSGRIGFDGSISRGLQLQVVQSDLCRLYVEARSQVLEKQI